MYLVILISKRLIINHMLLLPRQCQETKYDMHIYFNIEIRIFVQRIIKKGRCQEGISLETVNALFENNST